MPVRPRHRRLVPVRSPLWPAPHLTVAVAAYGATAGGLWLCWRAGNVNVAMVVAVTLAVSHAAALVLSVIVGVAPVRFWSQRGWHAPRWGGVPAVRTVGLAVGAITVGLLLASGHYATWDHQVQTLGPGRYGAYRVEVVALPQASRYGQSVRAVVIDGWANRTVVSVSTSKTNGRHLPDYGRRALVTGLLRPVDPTDWFAYAAGVQGELHLVGERESGWAPGLLGVGGRAQRALTRAIHDVGGMSPRARALLIGLVTGGRVESVDTGIEEMFRAAGVSHILSVSGSHLAVVAGGLAWALQRAGAGRTSQLVATVAGGLWFTAATGGQSAAWRALGMLALVGCLRRSTRRVDPVATVALVGIALLVANALSAVSVGTILSLTAVLGIVLFSRLAARWVGGAVGITVSAQLGTYPVALATFGSVAPYAVAANLAVVPLASLALIIGLVGAGIQTASPWVGLLRPAAHVLIGAAGVVAEWAVRCAELVASLPGAAATVPQGAGRPIAALAALGAAVGLYLIWPVTPHQRAAQPQAQPPQVTGRQLQAARKLRRGYRITIAALAVLLALFAAYAPWQPIDSVTVLDVGQGDATLIRSGRHVALVDAGPDPARLWWELAIRGVWRVDVLVLTHDHEDHIAGAGALALSGVSRLVVASGAQRSARVRNLAQSLHAQVTMVQSGATVANGSLRIHVLAPRQTVTDPSANESCVVAVVTGVDPLVRGVLLGGDAEAQDTLGALAGWRGRIDVLKVGHHGSSGSINPGLLNRARPSLAVISVGAGNNYGHPTETTIAALGQAGIATHRTDRDGSLTLKW